MKKVEKIIYTAYNGKEFDTMEECKAYELYVGADLIMAVQKAKNALEELDNFCELWTKNCKDCSTCPIQTLCEARNDTTFEDQFSEHHPFDYYI